MYLQAMMAKRGLHDGLLVSTILYAAASSGVRPSEKNVSGFISDEVF